jgi:hypothetical protein
MTEEEEEEKKKERKKERKKKELVTLLCPFYYPPKSLSIHLRCHVEREMSSCYGDRLSVIDRSI